jgi:hypothetical protein
VPALADSDREPAHPAPLPGSGSPFTGIASSGGRRLVGEFEDMVEGKGKGQYDAISAPFSPLAVAAASLSPPMGATATAPRASTRRLGAREQ